MIEELLDIAERYKYDKLQLRDTLVRALYQEIVWCAVDDVDGWLYFDDHDDVIIKVLKEESMLKIIDPNSDDANFVTVNNHEELRQAVENWINYQKK